MGTNRTGPGAAFHPTTCLRGGPALTSPDSTEGAGEQALETNSMQAAFMKEMAAHRQESVGEGRLHEPS